MNSKYSEMLQKYSTIISVIGAMLITAWAVMPIFDTITEGILGLLLTDGFKNIIMFPTNIIVGLLAVWKIYPLIEGLIKRYNQPRY